MPDLDRLLAQSVSGMPDPFLLAAPDWDAAGNLVRLTCFHANPAAGAQWGLTGADLVGRDLGDLLPGQPPRQLVAQYADVLRTGTPLVVDDAGFALVHDHGRAVVLDLMAYRVQDRLAVTWRDIAPARAGTQRFRVAQANRTFLAVLGEGIVVQDAGGNVLMANAVAARMLGLTPDQISGRAAFIGDWQTLHEDGTACPSQDLPPARVVRTGRPVRDVVIGLQVDQGAVRWLLVNSEPVLDPVDGTTSAVATSMTDITGYRQARAALVAADRQFAEVIDALADPLFVLAPTVGASGRIVELAVERANRAGAALLGARGTQPCPLPEGLWPTGAAQELLAGFMAAAQRTWDSGEPCRLVTELPAPGVAARDGSPTRRTFEVGLVRVDGAGLRLAAIGHDVTDDLDLRAALEASRAQAEAGRQQLAATLDSLLDPHAMLRVVRDAGGAVLDLEYADLNEAATRYWGTTREDLVGTGLRHLLPPDVAPAALSLLAGIVESGEPMVLDDFPAPPGVFPTERRFDLRGVMVGDLMSLTWRDVTDRHRAATDLARSQARFRALASASSDIICHTSQDRIIEYISPAVTGVLGWEPRDLVGTSAIDLWHPHDREGSARMIARARRSGSGSFRGRLARPDGSYCWVEVRISTLGREGNPGGEGPPAAAARYSGFVAIIRDIEEQRQIEQDLRTSRELLRGVIDTFADPWVLLAAVRGESGAIVDFIHVDANPAACRDHGRSREELIGMRLLDLQPEHGPAALLTSYARVVDTGEPWLADDLESLGSDGTVRHYDRRAVRVADGLSVTWRDVTERYLAREELARIALIDPLTGLVNREELRRRTEEVFGQESRDRALAIVFCDLDRFKEINDSLGHAGGDLVLQQVAARISGCVRAMDVVARVGGDEFVVVLTDVPGATEAVRVAEKIRSAVGQPMVVDGQPLRITLSAGVALSGPGADPNKVMREADAALYCAKSEGRDRVAVMGSG